MPEITIKIPGLDEKVSHLESIIAQLTATMANHSSFYVVEGVEWVTTKKIEDLFGFTEKAISRKIERGFLLEGKHWKWTPDNVRVFNIKTFNEWLKQKRTVVSMRGKHRSSSICAPSATVAKG